MIAQFVILYHFGWGCEHWDLMMQDGQSLRTWRLLSDPFESLPVLAERIGDHRLEYLTYEGPVSGGRGEVRREDAGIVCWGHEGDDGVVFELAGRRLRGTFRLVAFGDRWELQVD